MARPERLIRSFRVRLKVEPPQLRVYDFKISTYAML